MADRLHRRHALARLRRFGPHAQQHIAQARLASFQHLEVLMIDHIGFPVSDYERAKTFYIKALAPLGYSLIMEVTQEDRPGEPAAGFGAGGKPDFWIGGEGGLNKPMHVAILAKDRATVDAFYRAALSAGGRDNGAP